MSARKPRVFVSCIDILPEILHLLQEKCEVFVCNKDKPTKEEVYSMVKGVNALFWFWLPSCAVLDKEFLDAAGPELQVISLMSSGYNHLDLKEIKKRGIKVGYLPNLQDEAVSEIALTLLLSVIHTLQEGAVWVNRGGWTSYQQHFLGYEICESTVGIIGLGGVGQAIAKRVKGFEPAKMLYCGRTRKPEAATYGAEYVSFDELLKLSDYIIISCRLTPETRGMFNAAAFDKMKKTSVLINVARGEIVDHDALLEALKTGKIWGAGLDVPYPEPLPPDSPLLGFYNCVVTPHIGSATTRVRRDMAILAAKNILAALEGQPMPSPLF